MLFRTGFLVAFLLAIPAQATAPLDTVPHVDLPRFMGTWYEIARLPQNFQRGCIASTTNYSLKPNGKLRVINTCRDEESGKIRESKGTARIADQNSNAKLKVSFFWPFEGDHWIVELDPNYEFAVVGHPQRRSLWILSRAPHIRRATFDELIARLTSKHGYDLADLIVDPLVTFTE
jgi:apolipoprotein D and lipocalin family protein